MNRLRGGIERQYAVNCQKGGQEGREGPPCLGVRVGFTDSQLDRQGKGGFNLKETVLKGPLCARTRWGEVCCRKVVWEGQKTVINLVI